MGWQIGKLEESDEHYFYSNKSDMTEVNLIIHNLSNLPEGYEVTGAELEKGYAKQIYTIGYGKRKESFRLLV